MLAIIGAMTDGRPVDVAGLALAESVAEASVRRILVETAEIVSAAESLAIDFTVDVPTTTIAGLSEDVVYDLSARWEAGESEEALAAEASTSAGVLREAMETIGAVRGGPPPSESVVEAMEQADADVVAGALESRALLVGPRPAVRAGPDAHGDLVHPGRVFVVEVATRQVTDWLEELRSRRPADADECVYLIRRYADDGQLPNKKLKPLSGPLAGFHEIRFGGNTQQRLFHKTANGGRGRRVLVLLCGFTKKRDDLPKRVTERILQAWAQWNGGGVSRNSPARDLLKGRCSVCARDVVLTPRGRVQKHYVDLRGNRVECAGGNVDPALAEAKPMLEQWLEDPQVAAGVVRVRLLSSIQESIDDVLWRRNLTRDVVAGDLGWPRAKLDKVLDDPGASFEDVAWVAASLHVSFKGTVDEA